MTTLMTSEPDLSAMTLEEAERRVNETAAASRQASEIHREAVRAHGVVLGRQTEGRNLARLAVLDCNETAAARLDEQARALHPGIVGVLPKFEPDWTNRSVNDMEALGLLVDVPSEVDAEYVDGLAAAMRTFVHTYQPKYNSPKARSKKPGFAYAETRAGMLAYGVKKTRPAFLVPLDDFNGDEPADVNYRTLEEALTALPTAIFLASLGKRPSHYFRQP